MAVFKNQLAPSLKIYQLALISLMGWVQLIKIRRICPSFTRLPRLNPCAPWSSGFLPATGNCLPYLWRGTVFPLTKLCFPAPQATFAFPLSKRLLVLSIQTHHAAPLQTIWHCSLPPAFPGDFKEKEFRLDIISRFRLPQGFTDAVGWHSTARRLLRCGSANGFRGQSPCGFRGRSP